MDSGLGMSVFKDVFCEKEGGKEEDKRVLFAASNVICNLVNDCSPLRMVSGFYNLFAVRTLMRGFLG